MSGMEEKDLYAVLGIDPTASKDDVRKAYRKLALLHHPDKVAEADREAADRKFKDIGQAYEILNDDQKRERYDTEGMAAFDPARNSGDMGGMPPDIDLADILSQMMFNSGPPLEEPLTLAVTLEDLYNGKLKKVRLEKNVICDRCNGHGGKEGTVPKECRTCNGRGQVPRRAGNPYTPHMIVVDCPTCSGNKKIFTEKEKCKKCKGKGVNKVQKYVEIYVAPGSEWGEKERLIGEADQVPGKPPADLVIVLVPSTTVKKSPSNDDAPPEEDAVSTFERQGKHLFTKINLTLAEALFGFSKIVVKHLDGRGIHLNYEKGNVLQPGQVIKVSGEGMPVKKQNYKGDLYLVVNVKFPEGTLLPESRLTQFQALVPQEAHNISAIDVDEVDFEVADLADLENDHDEEDTDNEDETQPHPQCAQQ